MQKSPLSPNYGEVRLYWLGEVLDSRPIATYPEIFFQIGLYLVVRYPLRNVFALTHTQVNLKTSFLGVSVLVESENVLSSTSNFSWYSIRSTSLEIKRISLTFKKNIVDK